MIKRISIDLKNGLSIAADSFVILYKHPVLLTYYAILSTFYCTLFIIAYNIIGYHVLCCNVSHEFDIPNQNLLTEIIPKHSGLLYIALILSVFINIFLRTYLAVALIHDGNNLLNKKNMSIKHALEHAYHRFMIIIQWTLFITVVTCISNAFSQAPFNPISTLFITSIFLILWSLASFFMLPIITLKNKTLVESLKLSIALAQKTFVIICGGMIWFGIMFCLISFGMFALVTLIQALRNIPATWVKYISVFIINTILSSALLIFKTILYQQSQPTPQDTLLDDYSQF